MKKFEVRCDKCHKVEQFDVPEEQVIELTKMSHKNCGGNISYSRIKHYPKGNAEYVMVTWWDGHWDKKKETSYTRPMLRDGITVKELLKRKGEDIEVIFLKRDENVPVPNKAWEGFINIFEFKEKDLPDLPNKKNRKGCEIWFNIIIKEDGEIEVPEEYQNYVDGWHRARPKPDKYQKNIEDAWL